MLSSRDKNILYIGLCMIVILMVFGYGFNKVIMHTPDAERQRLVKSDVDYISELIGVYHNVYGYYPASLEEIAMVLQDNENMRRERELTWYDPWGEKYIYLLLNKDKNFGYVVVSLGSDKKLGGTGLAEDIYKTSMTDIKQVNNYIRENIRGSSSGSEP